MPPYPTPSRRSPPPRVNRLPGRGLARQCRGNRSAVDLSRSTPDDPVSERSASDLDDRRDREELRSRYYGILQELRVILPGVQVLAAFLLIAPFSERFEELDGVGRTSYLVALLAALVAAVCFISPTAQHRAGDRAARSVRVTWAVRMTKAGLVFTAVAFASATYCVTRFVFDDAAAAVFTVALSALIVVAWVLLPLWASSGRRTDPPA